MFGARRSLLWCGVRWRGSLREVESMVIVLAREQEEVLRQMAADLDMEPESLVEHLVSDRLARSSSLSLWSE